MYLLQVGLNGYGGSRRDPGTLGRGVVHVGVYLLSSSLFCAISQTVLQILLLSRLFGTWHELENF